MWWGVCVLLLSTIQVHGQQWTGDFAVETELDQKEVDLALGVHGFAIVRKMSNLGNVYHLVHADACSNQHRCKRHAADLVSILKNNPYVKHVEQQFVVEHSLRGFHPDDDDLEREVWNNRERDVDDLNDSLKVKYKKQDDDYVAEVVKRTTSAKRIGFNDPGWKYQWQSNNVGQFKNLNPGVDMNLVTAYRKGYHGEGVPITVVDDGIDTSHPDIKGNYDPAASIDLNDPSDSTGNPRSPKKIIPTKEGHGTSCAGEVAGVANNRVCGVGVAYKANLGGIRLLAGTVTDLLEAYALTHNNQYIQVYTNSWGPKDNGFEMKMPLHYTSVALHVGVKTGRGGLGSIFTFASGNGGYKGDNCGADGYVNSPYTIAFASINIYAVNTAYDEQCSALSAAVPVGGLSKAHHPEFDPRVISAAINNHCTSTFSGTSAASPLGSACITLALQANPKLTWRDVQHLVHSSTRVPNRHQKVWQINGAGIPVSHHFGFGLLDCARLIQRAQNWTNVAPQHNCTAKAFTKTAGIYAKRRTQVVFQTDGCLDDPKRRVTKVEHVLINVKASHVLRGDVAIWLTSPAGTRARLLNFRNLDKLKTGITFRYLSLLNWGEHPSGKWTLEIVDRAKLGPHRRGRSKRGQLMSAQLTFLGTGDTENTRARRRRAKVLTGPEVADLFDKQRHEFIRSEPEHRKTFELKKRLTAMLSEKSVATVEDNLQMELQDLEKDEDISKEELKSVIDLVEKLIQRVKDSQSKKEKKEFNEDDVEVDDE